METSDAIKNSEDQDRASHEWAAVMPAQTEYVTTPTDEEAPCSTCGGKSSMPMSYVYALGQIEARFPRLAVEKEYFQVVGRSANNGKTDQQLLKDVLSNRANRYLARQMCWVFSIQGLETYILQPRDPVDLDLLVESLRSGYDPGDIDLVVGVRGPIAPPEMCNGLMVPIVGFDQIYSFSRAPLVKAIPRPEKTSAEKFGPAAEAMLDRIMRLADNVGAMDEHRALNYLAVRYPTIYARAVEQFGQGFSLTGIETRPSPLSTTRNIVDVIFVYTNRNSYFVEKFFVRCDVTEEFPFLVSGEAPYFDR